MPRLYQLMADNLIQHAVTSLVYNNLKKVQYVVGCTFQLSAAVIHRLIYSNIGITC